MARDRLSGRDRPDGADDDPTQQLQRLRSRDVGGDGDGIGDTAQFPAVPDEELAAQPQRRRRRFGPGVLIGAGVLAVALILSGLTAVGVGPVSSLLGTHDTKDASRSPSTKSSTGSSNGSSGESRGASAPSSTATSSSATDPTDEPSTQPSAAPKGPAGTNAPAGPRGRGGPAAPAGNSHTAPSPPAGPPDGGSGPANPPAAPGNGTGPDLP